MIPNDNASVEKLANSLVLGTNVARLVGSSPTRRTIREVFIGNYKNVSYIINNNYKSCCISCCINDNCCMSDIGRMANNVGYTQCVRLRKLCHPFYINTCAYNLVSTTIIIKKTISTHVHNSMQHMQHISCNKPQVQIFQTNKEHQ